MVIIFFLFGCASTFPAPRIDGNVYVNDEHGIKVTIPTGWTASQQLPQWMKKYLLNDIATGQVHLYMFSKQDGGSIILGLEKACLPSVPKINHNDIKNGFYKNMVETLKSNYGSDVAFDDLKDYDKYALINSYLSYDWIDLYIGFRFTMYRCGECLCVYSLTGTSIREKRYTIEHIIKNIEVSPSL